MSRRSAPRHRPALIAILFAALALSGGPATPQDQSPPPDGQAAADTDVPKASERFENLQVLGDLPADELRPTMNFFRSSLGVGCSHCHVRGAFEKDDLEEKRKAREMIRMVMDINGGALHGGLGVNCDTCHRGSTWPAREIRIPWGGVVSLSASEETGEPPARPSPEEVLSRYLEAVGGQEAFDALDSLRMHGTLASHRRERAEVEIVRAAPDRMLDVRRSEESTSRSGFDGTVAWRQEGDEEPELREGAALERHRRLADLSRPMGQRPAESLVVLGHETLGDREVVVLQGPSPESDRDERLSFDRESGLLLRITTLDPSPLGANPVAFEYDDYRDVGGVMLPFLHRTVAPDFTVETRFDSIERGVEVDEAAFAPPGG
jgi:hypothetical protein